MPSTATHQRRLFVFDTDMGADDALALYLASRWISDDLIILTCFGNVPEDQAYENAFLLNKSFGLGAPIYRGAKRSMSPIETDAKEVHGADGLGGATIGLRERHGMAPDDAQGFEGFEAHLANYDSVDWLAIGPATNLANILETGVAAKLENVMLMSGSFFDPGNISPYAEFNAYADPVAVGRVVSSGVPLTMVPLDICKKVQLHVSELKTSFSAYGESAAVPLTRAHEHYCRHYLEWEGFEGCFPHDSIALYIMLKDDHITFAQGTISVETAGKRAGATTLTPSTNGPHKVALGGNLKMMRQSLLSGVL